MYLGCYCYDKSFQGLLQEICGWVTHVLRVCVCVCMCDYIFILLRLGKLAAHQMIANRVAVTAKLLSRAVKHVV